MALVAMADYVDGIEDLKIAMGYGLPVQYPLGISGFGATSAYSESALNAAWKNYISGSSDPEEDVPQYNEIQGYLNDGDVRSAYLAMSKQGIIKPVATYDQQHPTNTASDLNSKLAQGLDAFKQFYATIAPSIGHGGRPKQKTYITKQQDWTTPAVVGGAVLVAVVLAIAVGKSGRRDH